MPPRLYHQAILDAAAAQTGRGAVDGADASVSLDNPLCGDRVRMDVTLKGPRLERVGHEVRGCLLCEAAAAVIGGHAPGESVEDLIALSAALRDYLRDPERSPPRRWSGLEMFDPVAHYRSRHECVMLPFDALVKALEACPRG